MLERLLTLLSKPRWEVGDDDFFPGSNGREGDEICSKANETEGSADGTHHSDRVRRR